MATKEDLERMLANLEGKGPSRDEVTVSALGRVQQAVYFSRLKTEAAPQDIMTLRFGGPPGPTMRVRYDTTELSVALQEPADMVKKIIFPAHLSLVQGDHVRVYFLAADVKRTNPYDERDQKTYLEKRDLKAEDAPFKIEKLDGPGLKVIATYIAE